MAKYKINIDPKTPSKDKIESYKAFDQVVKRRKKLRDIHQIYRTFFKDKRLFSLIIVIVSLLLIFVIGHEKKGTDKPVNTTKISIDSTGKHIEKGKDTIPY